MSKIESADFMSVWRFGQVIFSSIVFLICHIGNAIDISQTNKPLGYEGLMLNRFHLVIRYGLVADTRSCANYKCWLLSNYTHSLARSMQCMCTI